MATKAEKITTSGLDFDRFRLRRFMEHLAQIGEVETVSDPIDMVDVAARLDGNAKAVWFTQAGPEKTEIVGNVVGSRSRIALAFGVAEGELREEVSRRLETPQPIVDVPRSSAPCQEIVLTGADADLTALPATFQHEKDGGPYISASIDYVVNPETGWTNIGMRRLMLRGATEAGIDLVTPSDLRAIYIDTAAKSDKLPIAFTVGAHPIDCLAAVMRRPVDEIDILAALRGAPLPVVKCVTSDIRVPADAEIVIEGYLDANGHVEGEGPYGEFLGYYGPMKRNPVFHLTAITRRKDALFQTATIGGKNIGRTDTANLASVRTEQVVWDGLRNAVRDPIAVYASPASGGLFNVRIALQQRVPGDARNAIAAAHACLGNVKNVFVVDPDIDIFSDEQMDWALATRFQPHRDLVVQEGMRTLPLDPSLDGEKTGSKAGFDLTLPLAAKRPITHTVPSPPVKGEKRFDTVEQALAEGPKMFGELMNAVGSRDGRDIVRDLDKLRQAGRLNRIGDGEYELTGK